MGRFIKCALLSYYLCIPSEFQEVFIVTDIMYSDLKKVISVKKLCTNTVRSLAFQMIEGLDYLHSRQVIHGDLKPEIIVINWRGKLKICNFGSAINADTDNMKWPKTEQKGIISLRYSAPECSQLTTKVM